MYAIVEESIEELTEIGLSNQELCRFVDTITRGPDSDQTALFFSDTPGDAISNLIMPQELRINEPSVDRPPIIERKPDTKYTFVMCDGKNREIAICKRPDTFNEHPYIYTWKINSH